MQEANDIPLPLMISTRENVKISKLSVLAVVYWPRFYDSLIARQQSTRKNKSKVTRSFCGPRRGRGWQGRSPSTFSHGLIFQSSGIDIIKCKFLINGETVTPNACWLDPIFLALPFSNCLRGPWFQLLITSSRIFPNFSETKPKKYKSSGVFCFADRCFFFDIYCAPC